jgi:transcriptional regulator with XRE-family HTH domain
LGLLSVAFINSSLFLWKHIFDAYMRKSMKAFPCQKMAYKVCVAALMRIEPRHAVAALRAALNLTQQQMAALAGVSKPTIQAIELGKLPLIAKNAATISKETGADVAWLMRGEPTTPVDNEGNPVTLETFANIQAFGDLVARDPFASYVSAFATVVDGMKALMHLFFQVHGSKAGLLQYRISEKFHELYSEFSPRMVQHPSAIPITAGSYCAEIEYRKAVNDGAAQEVHKLGHAIDKVMRTVFKARGWLPEGADPSAESFLQKFNAKVELAAKASIKKAKSKTTRARRPRSKGRGNS